MYFSNDNGLAESKYVFFDHNNLNNRWFSCKQSSFRIAETGFGTGLNFLLTWQLFRNFIERSPETCPLQRLYFTSTEKFPIAPEQLQQALLQWPELQELSEQLLVQYPVLTPGCHRLSFDHDRVILDLWLGDINETLPEIMTSAEGLVDAWYLDGFAPGKNPDMWQDPLFSNMARLSKPECSFATFTAAGIVKRGLRDHGFVVKKAKGFGRKRDMLVGLYAPQQCSELQQNSALEQSNLSSKIIHPSPLAGPFQRLGLPTSKDLEIAIVGAGLAGANLASALSQRGFKVAVYCADDAPAMGASGNHIGGFYPSLNADFSLQSQFYCHAFSYARNRYDRLAQAGFSFGHDWCGVFFPAFSDEVQKRQQKLLANNIWPESLIRGVDDETATSICGLDMPYEGLFIPQAGWINPQQLVNALFDSAKAHNALLHTGHALKQMQHTDSGWQLCWQHGGQSHADIVVLATGADSLAQPFLKDIPFTRTRGQVDLLPQTNGGPAPKTVICHKGYFTPFHQQLQAMGATFDKQATHALISDEDSQQNRETLYKALSRCAWLDDLPTWTDRRAAMRLSLPDHKPVMGTVPDFVAQKQQYAELYKALPLSDYPQPDNIKNLFVLTGLGSHGLCSSPLLAEALACQISGEPLPLGQSLLASLSPNRFLIRNLIRRKV